MSLPIPEAIERFRKGEVLILTDHEDRENEGDFVCAAEHITPEIVNFMVTHGRGLLCVPLVRERMDALRLRRMVQENTALLGTNFTVSVDAVEGATTGISASDRALTIRLLADPATRPIDLARPGHVFPIMAMPGGVLERAGHTEAVCDLARLAGLQPVGALVEILNEDGSMARRPELEVLAERHNIPIATISDLIHYRLQHEQVVEKVVETTLPNAYGTWRAVLFENRMNGETHTALVLGDADREDAPLVRVHSMCFTGDTLGSQRCDCQAQLHVAMQTIAEAGSGVLLYMQQEGRGIGLKNKLKAYALQDQGKDTVEANEALGFAADLRHYDVAGQILKELGLKRLRMMTNNPRKIQGMAEAGLEVVERIPIEVGHQDHNAFYLKTKALKLGHLFDQTRQDA